MNTPEDREQIRISILRYLEAAGDRDLSATVLWSMVRVEGWRGLTRPELIAEVRYLQDKGFVAPVSRDISPELSHWRITATGRDWLAQHL